MIGGLCLLDMEQLSKFMKNSNLSKQDKILLILAWNVDHPKYTSDISKIGNQAGGKSVDKWGVYNYLLGMRKTGLVHDKTYGWELTEKGKKFVKEKFNVGAQPPIVTKTANSLRKQIVKINNSLTVDFLEEGLYSLEYGKYRAAVVLIWAGAISLLHEHVVKNHLSAFNNEAKRRNNNWRDAVSTDDLNKMGDHDFLQIIEYLSIIGKNTKQRLEQCRQLSPAG